ncbi:MAG: hypothetical protein HYX56_01450 [Chloroflexi bacterium]|nr:hypothetical protein [Chloroflexota bacterium]
MTAAAPRAAWRSWGLALLLASVFAVAASRAAVNDGDLFWQLATARWVVEHGALARTDTFSSTALGAQVPQHEWLSQMLLYAAYSAASWWGIVAVRTVAVLLLATVVVATALRSAPRPLFAAIASAPALALVRIDWNDRVELYGLVCFAVFLWAIVSARDGRTRALAILPPLFALWANLHGGFAVGVVLLAVALVEVAIFAPALRRAFAVATAATVLATFVNPDGPRVYENPAWHLLDPPRFIEEWRAPDLTTATGTLFFITLAAVIAVALAARTGPRWIALLAPLAFLGLLATRNAPLFALAAAPFLASALPRALERLGAHSVPATRSGPPLPISLALATLVTASAIAAAAREPDLSLYPTAALPYLRADGVLLNEYMWGGYLIWATGIPVFVDGRLRPYVGPVLDDYLLALDARPGWDEVLDRYGVTQVLLRPTWPLVAALRERGWRRIVDDPGMVLLRRP